MEYAEMTGMHMKMRSHVTILQNQMVEEYLTVRYTSIKKVCIYLRTLKLHKLAISVLSQLYLLIAYSCKIKMEGYMLSYS